MKKTSIFCIVVFMFIQFSCSKQLQNQNTSLNSTTNPTLKSESTGVTLADATQLAKSFLQSKNTSSTVIIENAQTIVKNGKPYFHVINADKGFVILSPDSIYEPILAYDSVGNFSFEEKNLNPGLKMWLNKHASELDFVRNIKSIYVDSIKSVNKKLWQAVGNSAKTHASLASNTLANGTIVNLFQPTFISSTPTSYSTNSTVGPLCSTTAWSEDAPFNDYCPVNASAPLGYNGHDPAGWVPIAIAQLMYFWKYPTSYNWTSMPLKQLDALSLPDGDLQRLIWNVGNGHTNYAPGGSATAPESIPDMFSRQTYTSCSATESQAQQDLSGADDGITYANLLTNELQNNKRPCIISGFPIYHGSGIGALPYAGGVGHTWVCDGSNITNYYYGNLNTYRSSNGTLYQTTSITSEITTSLLHMNWGWRGGDQHFNLLANNGWYDCSVNYTQASSASDNFQYFQIVDYNIHP